MTTTDELLAGLRATAEADSRRAAFASFNSGIARSRAAYAADDPDTRREARAAYERRRYQNRRAAQ